MARVGNRRNWPRPFFEYQKAGRSREARGVWNGAKSLERGPGCGDGDRHVIRRRRGFRRDRPLLESTRRQWGWGVGAIEISNRRRIIGRDEGEMKCIGAGRHKPRP